MFILKLEQIETILEDLQTVPLDYEIEEGGCQNPENLETEEYTSWFYAMRPIKILEELKKLGEIKELCRMYLSEEDLAAFSLEEDLNSQARFLWFNYKSAKPSGIVKFYDKVLNREIPLENVKITISQWCHVETTYTDSQGKFVIDKNFTSCWQNTANIKVTFSKKDSDFVCSAFSPITAYYNVGNIEIDSLNNITILLKENTKQANFARIIKASTIYRNFAKTDNITLPKSLKFWMAQDIKGSVTFMRDVIVADLASSGVSIGSFVNPGLGTVIGTFSGAILGSYFPDIIIGLKNNTSKTVSELITENVFHEMSHASHYTSIGIGQITYWNSEYLQMIGGWIELLCNSTLPSTNCYNDGKSEQVCLIESWAYFYGFDLTNRYYNSSTKITETDYNDYLENKNTNYTKFLFYKAFYDLIDNKNEYGDKCESFSVSQIFAPYKNFSVNSLNSWYKKFIENFSTDYETQQNIKETFSHNGFEL